MALMTSRWRTIVSVSLLVGFFAWAAWYVSQHRQEFAVLAGVPWWCAVALFLTSAGIICCNGLYVKIVLQVFDIHLSLKECLSLAVATTTANYIIPLRGGAGFRALYLKARYQFSFTDFLSTLSAMYLMYFVIHGLMGILGMALLWADGKPFDLPLAGLFAAVTSLALIFMLCRINVPRWEVFPFRHLARIVEGWTTLRQNRSAFLLLLSVTTIYALLSLVLARLTFLAIHLHLPWGGILFYTAGQSMALLVTITPGALGIAEWMSIYMGTFLSYNASEALMVQLLFRAGFLIVLLVSAPLTFRTLASIRRTAKPGNLLEPLASSCKTVAQELPMDKLGIAVLTDPGSWYAPTLLLESTGCKDLDIRAVYVRHRARTGPLTRIRKLAGKSGWKYVIFRTVAIARLKAWERIHATVLRTHLHKRPCLSLNELCHHAGLPLCPLVDVNSPRFHQELKDHRIDIVVSLFFSQILGKETIAIPKMGCLNVHPSLLPEFRGSNPVYWALAENRSKTGLTIHVIDQGIDTGSIIRQIEVPILPEDTHHSLYLKIAMLGSPVLRDTLQAICRSRQIVSTEQPHKDVKTYSKPTAQSFKQFLQSGHRFV